MGAVKTVLSELVGLFVDDGSLAAGAVIWAAICGWGLPVLGVGPRAIAALLALGLGALLLENTLRASGRVRRGP
ncbi:MAG TPA: hypothetical protein VKU84_04425 [Stellaceae bacterium]|nr:hypothetical protein [Stellaceae bacterium]